MKIQKFLSTPSSAVSPLTVMRLNDDRCALDPRYSLLGRGGGIELGRGQQMGKLTLSRASRPNGLSLVRARFK